MKKTNIDNYYRQNDGSIINTNNAELNQYLESRKRLKHLLTQEEKMLELETKVDSLDSKLNLILEKLSNG
jgi:hypothetical protein